MERARANAAANGLGERAGFEVRNLFELSADDLQALGPAQRWLIDPPREGAFALAKAVADLVAAGSDWRPPQRIVYVSCNPATLARDAGLLVHQAGYRCTPGRRGQHVPAHGARGEHRGLRAAMKNRGPKAPFEAMP